MFDRHLDCDGLFNLRDLGGYSAPDGRTVRWRTLFRSDGLHRVAAGDDGSLRRLGWRTVMDLRSPAERELGSYAPAGVNAFHLPMLPEMWDPIALASEADDAVKFLTDRYLEMTESGASAIASAFDLLAAPEHLPAVFHCSIGKDRTGVLAALVLTTLGIRDDEIAADYSMSAAAMDRLVDWITGTHPDIAERIARQPAAFLACPPEAILGFLHALRGRHGSTDAYLHGIGVAPGAITAMREHLLEVP